MIQFLWERKRGIMIIEATGLYYNITFEPFDWRNGLARTMNDAIKSLSRGQRRFIVKGEKKYWAVVKNSQTQKFLNDTYDAWQKDKPTPLEEQEPFDYDDWVTTLKPTPIEDIVEIMKNPKAAIFKRTVKDWNIEFGTSYPEKEGEFTMSEFYDLFQEEIKNDTRTKARAETGTSS